LKDHAHLYERFRFPFPVVSHKGSNAYQTIKDILPSHLQENLFFSRLTPPQFSRIEYIILLRTIFSGTFIGIENFLRIESLSWSKFGENVDKKPSCVKAVKDVADFISSLESDSYLRQIIDKALDILKENMFAGQLIEKREFPKSYVQKYGITNLYKYNLDKSKRLIYTLAADESGIAVVVLEILNHKEYEKRFGYK
jgi:hypothetical protein